MGLGHRAPFFEDLKSGHPDISWLEVITENYLWDRGSRREKLDVLRNHYGIALHGVSLSVASPDPVDEGYLRALADFVQEISPVRVSDHLCWSSLGAHHWNDLLPFPYTEENLSRVEKKVHRIQEVLRRPLVLENLSAYVQARSSEMSEYEFLSELSRRSGCELLLDLNNMVVNQKNFSLDPLRELEKIDLASVAQVHLAGYVDKGDFVVDTHSRTPDEATWQLWSAVCEKRNDIPFMIEWDSDIPSFTEVSELLQRAQGIQRRTHGLV